LVVGIIKINYKYIYIYVGTTMYNQQNYEQFEVKQCVQSLPPHTQYFIEHFYHVIFKNDTLISTSAIWRSLVLCTLLNRHLKFKYFLHKNNYLTITYLHTDILSRYLVVTVFNMFYVKRLS